MEPRILAPEEIGAAGETARAVFDLCLRKSMIQPEMTASFERYVQPEHLRQMAEEGALTVWGIFAGGQLCAVSAMQTEGHITMLYVLPFFQRKGLGKLLLRTMRSYAGEVLHLKQVTVNAMPVWTAAYFERMGFTRAGMPQYGGAPFLSLRAKTIAEVRYPVKPVPEKAIVGISGGFLAAVFLIAVLVTLTVL